MRAHDVIKRRVMRLRMEHALELRAVRDEYETRLRNLRSSMRGHHDRQVRELCERHEAQIREIHEAYEKDGTYVAPPRYDTDEARREARRRSWRETKRRRAAREREEVTAA